jgi:hypothetical protein
MEHDVEPGMIEEVSFGGQLRALIVRREFSAPGVRFVTPNELAQQVGYMSHPTGHQILPHVHLEVPREVRSTQEVLILRKGRLRVDFYDDRRVRVESHTLEPGDLILLVSGGHGFEVLEACDLIEIKAGPYVEGGDKLRFTPATGEASDT